MAPKKSTKLKLVYCGAGLVAVAILAICFWFITSLLDFDGNKKPPR